LVGQRWEGRMMRAKYLNTKNTNEPLEISEVLGKVIENAAVGVDIRHADMIGRWESFVPPDWCSGTPVGIRNRILLVEVSDGTTASLLRYQMVSLIGAITKEYGEDLVRSVRIKIRHR